MNVTVPDVMRHVRNYFVSSRLSGSWQTQEGLLLPQGRFAPGEWIAVLDGPCAGVYQLDEYARLPGAADAAWKGRIFLLEPPAGFLRLCCEIDAWAKEHPDPAMTGERFGEYSRTLAHTDWTQAFAPALVPYTHMYTEVNL